MTSPRDADVSKFTDAERLSLALEAAKLGDWSWDAASDIVTLSPRAAEIFSIPPGPYMTWSDMRMLLHEDDRERARLAVESAVTQGEDYAVEYRVVSGAVERWVSSRGRGRWDAEGRLLGMLGVVQDITEEVRIREQLQEQTESLEIINRVGSMLSAELDLENLVQSLTDAATELVGAQFGSFFYNVLDDKGASYMLYTLSGVDRSKFSSFPMPRATALFGPTFRGEGVIRVDDVRADPRYGHHEPYRGMPAGHLPVRSYLAVPVISRSGDVLGGLFFGHEAVGVFKPREERLVVALASQAAIAIDNARLYESTRRAQDAAEDANRVKDEFLATVSHELRTPLNAVLGWARLLRSTRLDDESRERALDTIERNARAQQEIIEDILDVSRIVTGRLRLEITPVRLRTVVEAAVDSVLPAAAAKDVRVDVSLEAGDGLVSGDANRLQQVAWNLLSNAVKFTPSGGHVQVTLLRAEQQLELTVTDTGCGIAPEFLPYVFERFRQADAAMTRQHGGLGLGLSIVRHLVEMHGGTVRAESAGAGCGAAFIVRLPVAPPRYTATAETLPPVAAAPLPETALDGVSALVVDDEADARELVGTILRQCGARVQAADSARNARVLLRQWTPDIVVCDLGMPEEDGYTFIRELRRAGSRVPAVALTAYARSSDRARALAAGFEAHLAKPAEPAELIALIANLVRR